MIRGKVAEYMERAEKLKQHLNQNDESNRKKPSAMGANGKSSGGSGKGGKCVVKNSCDADVLTVAGTAVKKNKTLTPRSSAARLPALSSPRSPTFGGKM
jgi:hypothetical protein